MLARGARACRWMWGGRGTGASRWTLGVRRPGRSSEGDWVGVVVVEVVVGMGVDGRGGWVATREVEVG